LDFFQARYHGSAQGRFLSPDPAGNFVASAADPQSWNMYAYARNNPLTLIDPTGLDYCEGSDGYNYDSGDVNEDACDEIGGTWHDEPVFIDTAYSTSGGQATYYGDDSSEYLGDDSSGDSTGWPFGGGFMSFGQNTRSTHTSTSNSCPAVPSHPASANIQANISAAENSAWMVFALPRMFWFYGQVRNKGPWDYKQQGQSLNGVGNWEPSPYQEFGNFNFGATGAAAGIPSGVLLRGAGMAQEAAKTSEPAWRHWYGISPPYGDDPNDQAAITAGINYFKNGCAQ
jgi:RHS repeat-associated protein